MPRFHVKDTFTIEGRPYFIIAGSIVEGAIQVGMYLQIPMNSTTAMTARIECLEFARRLDGHEGTCLCIRYSDPGELDIWRSLDITGETFEVTRNA
jgi:hypothetical protein